MRIVLFHAWSTMGAAVGHALLDDGHEVTLVGAAMDEPEDVDPDLLAHAQAVGASCMIDSDEIVPALASLAPELLLVATFPRKLTSALLQVPSRGAFNVHASLLPAYRGAQPEFWALRNGERETGVTIHCMDDRFDGGAIVAQRALAITSAETFGTLLPRLGDLAAALARELVAAAQRGDALLGTPQADARASRAPRVTAEHLAIDWREPAAAIARLLRAAHPCFDATTSIAGERIVIRSAGPAEDAPVLAPGVIHCDAATASVWVGTGDVALRLDQLEVDDVRMDAATFAHARRLETGERCERA